MSEHSPWPMAFATPAVLELLERERRLRAAAPEMLALLRDLEFVDARIDGEVFRLCPGCFSDDGHAPNCRLAALLKRLGE